jgi:ketol-acid reductoisomerase
MVLAPDEAQAAIWEQDLKPNMREGTALAFAHGLNIHFGLIEPRGDMDVYPAIRSVPNSCAAAASPA